MLNICGASGAQREKKIREYRIRAAKHLGLEVKQNGLAADAVDVGLLDIGS